MQIEDILVGDKQLAKEILYDIKQAEQAKEDRATTTGPQAAAAVQLQPAAAQAQPGPGRSSGHAGHAAHHHQLPPQAASKPHASPRRASGLTVTKPECTMPPADWDLCMTVPTPLAVATFPYNAIVCIRSHKYLWDTQGCCYLTRTHGNR